jgi:hypothetical protein
MLLSEELEGEVTGFLVGQQRRLVLLEVFVLDGNVVQRNDHDGLSRFCLVIVGDGGLALVRDEELVLNQNQSFHGVVQGQVVLAQLA